MIQKMRLCQNNNNPYETELNLFHTVYVIRLYTTIEQRISHICIDTVQMYYCHFETYKGSQTNSNRIEIWNESSKKLLWKSACNWRPFCPIVCITQVIKGYHLNVNTTSVTFIIGKIKPDFTNFVTKYFSVIWDEQRWRIITIPVIRLFLINPRICTQAHQLARHTTFPGGIVSLWTRCFPRIVFPNNSELYFLTYNSTRCQPMLIVSNRNDSMCIDKCMANRKRMIMFQGIWFISYE